MPIPTRANYRMVELQSLADTVLGRLAIWYRAGKERNPRSVQEALQDFQDAVIDFVDSDERP